MLKKLEVGLYQANCYILGCDKTREGLIIDPGDEALRIAQTLTNTGIRVKAILLTHGHFDHTGAALDIKRITNAPVMIHRMDAPMLSFAVDGYLEEGLEITAGTYRFSIIHTPGHSAGSVCIHGSGVIFTGDTIFAGSIGRTDFPGGSHSALISAVKLKVFPLGDELRIYPGHGPPSTIGKERLSNPFLR